LQLVVIEEWLTRNYNWNVKEFSPADKTPPRYTGDRFTKIMSSKRK